AKEGLKVTNVIPLPHEFEIGRIEGLTLTEAHYSTASTSKIPVCKVQVCSKGTCRKRGSQAILSRLKQELKAVNYSNIEVHLETTGCQKACKQGPNIRVKQGRGKARSVNPKRSLAQMLKL
ncbi:MAG: (2Fe-2S) ferredoxin domain-containing protein, partial [Cyanobacteria bacterium P01_H01_bin.15]